MEKCPKCGAKRDAQIRPSVVWQCGSAYFNEEVYETHQCTRNQLAQLKDENKRLREQRVQLRKLVEHVAERNPYPPDIFIEPTKEQFTAFNAHLKEFGLDPSAYNGSMGRRTWRVCCEDILRAFDEYIEDTDEAALEQTP